MRRSLSNYICAQAKGIMSYRLLSLLHSLASGPRHCDCLPLLSWRWQRLKKLFRLLRQMLSKFWQLLGRLLTGGSLQLLCKMWQLTSLWLQLFTRPWRLSKKLLSSLRLQAPWKVMS